jgi:hypothetical protein
LEIVRIELNNMVQRFIKIKHAFIAYKTLLIISFTFLIGME